MSEEEEARLLAVAPEMLKELKDLLPMLDGMGSDWGDETWFRISKLVKRAEGRDDD